MFISFVRGAAQQICTLYRHMDRMVMVVMNVSQRYNRKLNDRGRSCFSSGSANVPGAWVSSFVERDNLEEGARLEHNTQSMSIIGINWY